MNKYKRVLPPIKNPTPHVYNHERFVATLEKMVKYYNCKNIKEI